MMQSNNREFAGKNEFWTPSSIGLTQSMIDSSINNILLNDNSSDLFKIEDNKLKTVDDLPIESKNFIISGSNDEIDSNENNAVNKRYLSNKIGNLDDKYMKKDVKSLNLNELNINTTKDTKLKIYSTLLSGSDKPFMVFASKTGNLNNNMLFMNEERLFVAYPLAFSYNTGINFNTRHVGTPFDSGLPQTFLKNLITTDITESQLRILTNQGQLNNVCPTYQFTENTYAKKSEVSTNLAWNSFSVYTTDGDDFKKQLSNISIKIAGSHITIPIPTDINSTNLIMSVDFTVRSTNKTALNALGCTLNSLSGSSTSLSETATRASVFSGYTTKGTCIRTNSPYEYKFSLICPFSTTRHKKAYLHFFFDDSVNYTANDEIYILATKTEPQVNVTIFGI